MALSKIVQLICEPCSEAKGKKIAFVETSRIDFGTAKLITGKCGHIRNETAIAGNVYEITSTKFGYHPRDYQVEGFKFVEQANGKCLIADEQGLGKTIQAVGSLKLHPEMLPAAVITKTTLTHQWFTEFREWCGLQGYLCQVIKTGKEMAMPGFDIYIMSYDMAKNDKLWTFVNQPKTLIIDECQAIKNHLSDRAKAVQELSRGAEHIIALSGTPIKNHAGEYFTILNILQPSRFPSYQGYIERFVDIISVNGKDKLGGIKNQELFDDFTSDFIIRRTRAEVAPEIPEVDRQFFHVELDKKLNRAYAEAMKELEVLMYADEDEDTMTSLIAIMTKMRKITGISKVFACVENVKEFLENEPERKLVIFAHHHDAVNLLVSQLDNYLCENGYNKVLNLSSSVTDRSGLVSRFREDPANRIMIASTLAAGEGLNLQFCSRAIMLERQWNPANEEQAEGRFARIGQTDNIVVTYMIASETIDEYFTELVEIKRSIIKGTLDKSKMDWNQNNLMKELAEVLLTKGKKKWVL